MAINDNVVSIDDLKKTAAYNGRVVNDNSIACGTSTGIGIDTNIYPGYGGGVHFPPSPPRIACQHVVKEHTVWDDGRVTGVCMHCDERVTFTTIPGSVGAVRIRRILEEISSPTLEGIADYLDEIDCITQLIDLELEEVEMAQKRAILAKRILLDRLSRANAKVMDPDL